MVNKVSFVRLGGPNSPPKEKFLNHQSTLNFVLSYYVTADIHLDMLNCKHI